MKIKRKAKGFIEYVTHDLWTPVVGEGPGEEARVVTFLKWGYLVVYGFWRDQCTSKAAALTYTTTLSIVPLLAVAFSIAKGLGVQNKETVRDFLLKLTAGREEVVGKIVSYIDNTNVQTLGWVGIGFLFVTIISVVGTVEKTFNEIWNVKRGRTLWRKFTDFFSVIVICPIILVVASSVSLAVSRQAVFQDFFSLYGMSYLQVVLVKLMPLFLIWVVFFFLYAFIPHTKVRLKSAAVGAIAAGTLWQITQWVYVHYQVGVSKYNAIYGSFAQLPLFLIWLFVSWVIVLLGAEISYAVQHLRNFEGERISAYLSLRQRQKVAVLALVYLTQRFEKERGPATVEDISGCLGVPARLVGDVFPSLSAAGLTVKADSQDGEAFVLGGPPDRIRILDAVEAVTEYSEVSGEVTFKGGLKILDGLFEQMQNAMDRSGANRTLRDLLNETEGIDDCDHTASLDLRDEGEEESASRQHVQD